MKYLYVLLILLFATSVSATTYCTWDGSQGQNCRTDNRGYIVKLDGGGLAPPVIHYNEHGFYELVTTEPTVGADQVKDAVVWGFAGSQISRTWTVRDMTTEELNNRTAAPMGLSDYYLWKALLVTGVITNQQAQDNLPAELIQAYQARQAMGQ